VAVERGAAEERALFVPDGPHWVPTVFSRGPWSPDALHGGPVAAMVARAVEGCDAPGPHLVSRLTLELLRPVPFAPLQVSADVVRPGRRIQVIDVRVRAGDHDVAWGRAVRIRTLDPSPDPAEVPARPRGAAPQPLPPPEQGEVPVSPFTQDRAFHTEGVEMRMVRGRFEKLGPSQVWVRLAVPVVPGETPTPLQRVAAASDFGNGVSSELPYDRYVFINPDLTVHLERMPEGEWIGLDASTRIGTPGTGLAQSVLWDEVGIIGRALQGLFVEPRG
jgi:Thioesterase-like superfamily